MSRQESYPHATGFFAVYHVVSSDYATVDSAILNSLQPAHCALAGLELQVVQSVCAMQVDSVPLSHVPAHTYKSAHTHVHIPPLQHLPAAG